MNLRWFLLDSGKLREQAPLKKGQPVSPIKGKECWFDIDQAGTEELKTFLEDLDLHPIQIARCIDSINNPGAVSFGNTTLLEYPTAFDEEAEEPGYLSILISELLLITIRHNPTPALDELQQELTAKDMSLRHLPQLVYLILDEFADRNVETQVEIRDEILRISEKMSTNPASVKVNDLSPLRNKVDKLVSLIENQLYCVSGLNTSDNKALQEPHRKAFIQDLISEAEIAQRGIYRLENRLNNLYSDYQMAGNDRVEKRLRFLTIVSVITLPLGLIAGLLGMNVGGVPGLSFRFGFLVVVLVMVILVILQFWYFKRNGWFD